MIKTNELMLGDLVRLTDGQIAKVRGLGVYGDIEVRRENTNIYGGEEDIEPIPLTEEILFKNGFEYEMEKITSTSNGYYIFRLEDFYIDIYTHSYGFGCATINYVHELQHLLRLCGLNDLADNFKIE